MSYSSVCVLAWAIVGLSEDAKSSAQAILAEKAQIVLADRHVSGRVDRATALDNIRDGAAGRAAQRSGYENAPGGEVVLDGRMLEALRTLAKEHSFRVSEIAGGSHSKNSRHYAGVAFDVDQLDGRTVSVANASVKSFMARCRALGATEVLGPGDPGHSSHIHAAWPRP
jgi:hypothetical protein